MKHNYQEGGKVKISGKWCYLTAQKGTIDMFVETESGPIRGGLNIRCADLFVEAYEPPKPKVYEWIPWQYIPCAAPGDWPKVVASMINRELTETHGDPTVRTYKGERPEELGLSAGSYVHIWDGESWIEEYFDCLSAGCKWRKQPPAPSE